MTQRAQLVRQRTRPAPRIVVLLVLSLMIYGAGSNIGAGTVLLLAAGMVVGTAWSVTGFARRIGALRVLLEPTLVTVEGPIALPLTVTVPRGVIGVVRFTEQPWSPLPRSGTSAQIHLEAELARGDAQQLDVELDVTDLFGLVRRRTTLTGPIVDVTPSLGAASAFTADTVEGAEDEWVAHALATNGTPATELRPWRPGEAIRAVHWAASERVGRLLLRPRGPETSQRQTLTIEDRPWTRDQLDVRCRDLAATAHRLVIAGVEVEIAAAGRVLPWGEDARRLLASLRPNANGS